MSKTQEKIDSLIGKKVEKNGNEFIIKSGKETVGMVVFETDKYPITYHKGTLEFTRLEGVEVKSKQQLTQIESKMNTENKSSASNQSLTTSKDVNQSLNGYDKLNNLLDNLLEKYEKGDDKAKEKIKNDLDVVIPIANAKINLFKVGLTAVSLANKI